MTGPKPSGPTHPTPTHPPKNSGSRGTSAAPLVPEHAAGAGPTPTLGMVVRDGERYLAQAIATLTRQFDPASGPQQEDAPWGPALVDRKLAAAVADVRSALEHLSSLTTDAVLPPAGSAVYPSGHPRRLVGRSLPEDHPGCYPGEADAPLRDRARSEVIGVRADPAVRESSGVLVAPGAGDSFWPGRPGFPLPDTARIAAGINAALRGSRVGRPL